jgi:hypothetical protein
MADEDSRADLSLNEVRTGDQAGINGQGGAEQPADPDTSRTIPAGGNRRSRPEGDPQRRSAGRKRKAKARPAPSANGHAGEKPKPEEEEEVLGGNEFEAGVADCLAELRVPLGVYMYLGGPKCVGKTTVAAALVAALTGRRVQFPGLRRRRKIVVLWWTAEENLITETIPRLRAAGANVANVKFPGRRGDGFVRHKLILPHDLELLKTLIIRYGAKLVVLDTLISFFAPGVKALEDQPCRRIAEGLQEIAHETGCTILGIRHTTKYRDGTKTDHYQGGPALSNVARMGLCVKRLGGPKDPRALLVIDDNSGNYAPPVSFTVKNRRAGRRVEWGRELDPEDPRLQSETAEGDNLTENTTVEGYIMSQLKDGDWHEAKPILTHCINEFKTSASSVYKRACPLIDKPDLRGKGKDRASWWRLAGGRAVRK